MLKRALLRAGFATCLLFSNVAQSRVYDDGAPLPEPYAAPGVLIVQYHLPLDVDGATAAADQVARIGVASIDQIHADFGVREVRRLVPRVGNPRLAVRTRSLDGFVRIKFPRDADADALRAALLADPLVERVDFAMVHPIHAVPNDPSFGSQWSYQDPQDNDVDGPEAWDIIPGDTLILLGDTDTGVQYDHPDLAGPAPYTNGNVWINWSEYAGVPGTDDDGNGYIDDIRGWDWVEVESWWSGEDGTDPDNDPMDFNGHGTHVGGIMAAMTNNATGGAGMAGGFYSGQRGCKIVPLRIGWSDNVDGMERGFVRMDFATQAFDYGVMMGVKAFNCSWGSSAGSGFRYAVEDAMAAGVSVVTSAGNSNTTTAGFLESKAGVINVASTTSTDTKSGFSSYGVEVEVSAPGSSIYNTYSNHGSPSYAWLGGTSMASPHVTGLIGLVRAYNPELEKHKVDSVVIHTADNIDAQNPAYIGLLGSGRINARRALEGTPFADFDVNITFGQAPLAVQYTDHSYLNPTSWDWDLGNGDVSTDTNVATIYTAPGKYTVSLTTQCDAGLKTTTKPDLIFTVVDTVGGLEGEGIVNHGGSVSLAVALTVEVDSMVIPFATTGTDAITLDSVTQTDPWAGLFPLVAIEGFDPVTGTGVLRYNSDTGAVTVETGTIATFHFSVAPATPGDELRIAPDSGFIVFTPYGIYEPLSLPTIARVAAFPQGDVTQDGFITSTDAINLVNYVFKSGTLPDPDLGKVNGDDVVDSGDLIYMVNYLFKGGPAPIG